MKRNLCTLILVFFTGCGTQQKLMSKSKVTPIPNPNVLVNSPTPTPTGTTSGSFAGTTSGSSSRTTSGSSSGTTSGSSSGTTAGSSSGTTSGSSSGTTSGSSSGTTSGSSSGTTSGSSSGTTSGSSSGTTAGSTAGSTGGAALVSEVYLALEGTAGSSSSPLVYGGAAALTSTIRNASNCQLLSSDSTRENISSAFTNKATHNLIANRTYTLSCTATNGQIKSSLPILVNVGRKVVISSSAGVTTPLLYGTPANISVNIQNATNCRYIYQTANEPVSASFTKSTGNLSANTNYKIDCTTPNGIANIAEVLVYVDSKATITAGDPSSVASPLPYQSETDIHVNTHRATSCFVSSPEIPNVFLPAVGSISFNTGSLEKTTTYILTCEGNGNISSVTVYVESTPPIATGNLIINVDGSTVRQSPMTWLTTFVGGLSATLTGFTANTVVDGISGWSGNGTPSSPNSLAFDGKMDAMNFGTLSEANKLGTGDFTFEFWAKPLPPTRSGVAGYPLNATFLLGQRNTCAQEQNFWNIQIDSGYVALLVDDSTIIGQTSTSQGFYMVQSASTIVDGFWKHIVAIRSGRLIKIYVNGVLETQTLMNSNTDLSSIAPLQVGNPCNKYTGGIAKVAYYKRALSDSEVSQNCKALKNRFAGATCNDAIPSTRVTSGSLWASSGTTTIPYDSSTTLNFTYQNATNCSIYGETRNAEGTISTPIPGYPKLVTGLSSISSGPLKQNSYFTLGCYASSGTLFYATAGVSVGAAGMWYQANDRECTSFCNGIFNTNGIRKVNAQSPEGARCASGESRPINIGSVSLTYGCWGDGCYGLSRIDTSSYFNGKGEFCYHPTQKHDDDDTDRTVGCFCK